MIGKFLVKRLFYALLFFVLLSIVSFIIIQLPPGDFVTTEIMGRRLTGHVVSEAEILQLEKKYGVDKPLLIQYFNWFANFICFDWGLSFEWNMPVINLVITRIPYSILITFSALLLSYLVAIPIGIYSAVHQYSIGDYIFTIIGFIGLATPSFLIAVIILYLIFNTFGVSLIGLYSPAFSNAPWSFAKFIDLLKHLPLPILILGYAGTAGLMRVMRNSLLDELNKQYVTTAKAKGVPPVKLLLKYPVRIAINPIVSTLPWLLPFLLSNEIILGVAMNLPTLGPLLYSALIYQDMYLAASIIMVLGSMVILFSFISDILLMWIDPRVRYE